MADEEKLPKGTDYAEASEDIWEFFEKGIALVDKGRAGYVTIEAAAEKAGIPAGKVATATANEAKEVSDGLVLIGIVTSGLKVYNNVDSITDKKVLNNTTPVEMLTLQPG